MATIYRATDTGLGRDVALKLLRPEYLRDPDFSSRFRQEAQAAASLSHPNVVTVYDYGEDPSGPYIVMELVDGEDLATILRRSGALPPRQVARIGAGVARALAAAHARGLVHRDVKPGNVLIGTRRPGQGRRLRDRPGDRRGAGDAARDDPRLGPLLQPGAGARRAGDGRLGHLQPRHRPVRDAHRHRGRGKATAPPSVALARLSGPIPDPMAVRPSVPPDLAAITRQALALDPNDRWPSAAVMADALEATLATGAVGGRRAAAARRRVRRPPTADRGRRRGRRRSPRDGRLGDRPPEPGRRSRTPRTPTPAPTGDAGSPPPPVAAADRRRPSSTRTTGRARWSGSPASSRSLLLAAIAFLVFQLASGRPDAGRAGHGPELRRA